MSLFENRWHISSFSGTGNCVEAKQDESVVHVRHSRHPDGPMLTFTLHEWRAFVSGVRQHEFDVPGSAPEVAAG